MLGIPREVAEHALHLIPSSKLAKQRLRRFDDERHRAIGEEIAKLLAAEFVKEVYHSDWLANLVLVKKKNGKWRISVDYTGLNKVCLEDHFPLPRIDQIVDSTSGCEILSFLDAYSGYHQITMKESDQVVTSFITVWFILLRNHAFWSKEHRCHLSTVHAAMLRGPNRPARPT